MRPRGTSLVFRASNSLRTSSPHVSLETCMSLSACFVSCSASRPGPRRDHAKPRERRTAVRSRRQWGISRRCTQPPWQRAPLRVFSVVLAIAAEDPKPKPGGIPLASLSGREARGVLGTGGRPRGPRSEMSDVSGFHVKDVPKALLPKGKGRDVYPRVQVNGLGCVCCVRAVCKCVVA